MSAPTPLSITTNPDGLAATGAIDAHTAPTLAEALAECSHDTVVLDLANIDFVDSSGLRVLIEAHQAAEESGRALHLANVSSSVNRLLEISGVSDYLHVVD